MFASHFRLSKRASPTPVFNGTCSSGAKWYACPVGSSSEFVGCCASDPCSSGCSQGNIAPASFDSALNFTFADASCGASSNFYTCNAGTADPAPFWGCCKSNPCQQKQVCPTGDLVPAFMERKEQFVAYTGNATAAEASSTPTATAQPDKSKTIAYIAGGVGGAVGLAAIIGVLIFLLCRARRKNRKHKETAMHDNGFPSETTPMNEKNVYRHSANPDAPPQYASPNPNSYPPSPALRPSYPPSPAFRPSFEPPPHDIQELPADLSFAHKSSRPNRLSELPSNGPGSPTPSELPGAGSLSAQVSPNPNTGRFSELPAEGSWMAELESPVPSPRPQQAGFKTIAELSEGARGDGRAFRDIEGRKG